eukprot:10108270-Alexandrium_andersonii.AAC.1
MGGPAPTSPRAAGGGQGPSAGPPGSWLAPPASEEGSGPARGRPPGGRLPGTPARSRAGAPV